MNARETMPNRRPSIKPMNRIINIQQLKKSKHRRANMRTHMPVLADTRTTEADMGWEDGWRS